MDRGLAVVLTILTGAALGLVEACSGAVDDPRPPVADKYGEMVIPGAGAAGRNTGGSGTGSMGTSGAPGAGGGLTVGGP